MSRLIASDHGLRALVALSQRPEGLRPAEVATILAIPFSSAERALRVLEADGLVVHRNRRFVSRAEARPGAAPVAAHDQGPATSRPGAAPTRRAAAAVAAHVPGPAASRIDVRPGAASRAATDPRAAAAVRFALAMMEPPEALAILARANRAVEFGGIDEHGAVLVVRRFAEAADEATLHSAIADLVALHGEFRVELLDKSALRERLLDDLAARDRALRMQVLAGSVDRSFPDRTRHGDEAAPLLRRLHDGVVVPSDRRLRALARRHGLRRMVAFGSATRADFRPDSDLDLFVEPVAGHRLGLRQRAALVADAETLFERDVDLVAAAEARPALAARIAREGVVLHGPAA
jgi:predicted nucleotidyltransferase